MKKSIIFVILLLAVFIILCASFLYHISYFRNVEKNIDSPDEQEKEKIVEILSHSFETENYSLKIGNIYERYGKKFAYITIEDESGKKEYIVDLKNEKVVRK